MRELLDTIEAWRAEGEAVAVATVVATWGSAPRPAGARMAIAASGRIAGSVSGGCVEGAVVRAAREVLDQGEPRLLRFGVADDDAWAVGLSCGGSLEVFVAPLEETTYAPLRTMLRDGRPAAAATVIAGPAGAVGLALLSDGTGPSQGSLAGELADAAELHLRDALESGTSRRVRAGDAELFVEALLPPPTLVTVGGVHIAVALAELAKTLGFRTVVVDPRTVFGSAERFPGVDRLITAWPDVALRELGLDRSSAVAVLTHDPKLDDPALTVALASPAFYVGALGSRATQERRRRRLLEAGVDAASLDRLYAPIGLDLGGRAPEEIALAVMAEIVAARHGRATSRADA